jgi:hypothetical protein
MRSAVKIYLSLHTQISRAEKQMRQTAIRESESRLECFGNEELDVYLIGGKDSLPGDATVLLKGERGTHKFALAANYLFQGLREGENVVLFNMGSPVEVGRIPQCVENPEHLDFSTNGNEAKNGDGIKCFKFEPRQNQKPPPGKYRLHWWISEACKDKNCSCIIEQQEIDIKDILRKHANLFILDFDAGFLLPEEFIATFIDLVDWMKQFFVEHNDNIPDKSIPFQRILLNSTSQIKTRFPVLDDETFLIPAFIRLTKCFGVSSMIIDVLQPQASGTKKAMSLDALSDLILSVEHNWENDYELIEGEKIKTKSNNGRQGGKEEKENEQCSSDLRSLKIITADNITGKVYEKMWLGLEISKDGRNMKFKEMKKKE